MTSNPEQQPILLLVEDDGLLRAVLELALADEGFEVVATTSGAQAIAELDATGDRFKAVITDIRLGPGPNGWDVGHKGREAVSGVPQST
ncbi:response regulator [Devosia naphthalenivorans]|uniref:response regulator n=1 Tax=Devosia naphthalenivorans TaxID=2082392 RepID=UPI001FE60571|nr:response regulator [Devosia naphthalenivorans]